MKNARLFTSLGSLILFGSAIFHATGYVRLVRRMQTAAIAPPLDGILKGSWLAFSLQFLALAVIAFLCRDAQRGGRIVLFCAAILAVDAAILLYFLGPFIGVYLLSIVTVLFLIGGWMQTKTSA